MVPPTKTEKEEVRQLGDEHLDAGPDQAKAHANDPANGSDSLYSSGGENSAPKTRGLRAFVKKRRRAILVATGAGGFLGGILVILSLFLAPLKLDFFAKNIEDVGQARLTHVFDRRSDRFIRSLIAAEMAGNIDGNTDKNIYFEGKGYLSSKNPITQWYKDIKVSRFFDELEKKEGIRFIRELGSDGVDRLVKIDTRGLDIDLKEFIDKHGVITPELSGELDNFVKERFENNKSGRRSLYDSIDSVSKRHRVLHRRHLRGWARDKLGIKKWTFFENTREDTRRAVRTRWTNAVTGYHQNGHFLRCLVTADCSDSSNLNDADNASRANASFSDGSATASNEAIDETVEEFGEEVADGAAEELVEGAAKAVSTEVTQSFAKKMAAKLTATIIPGLNILDWISTLRDVDTLLGDGLISKMVAVSRATEYATAFNTFRTIADQAKEGEDTSGEEIDAALEMLDDAEFSDGYTQVTQKQETAIAPIGAVYARHEDNQPHYDEVTDNLKVNNENNNAAKIESFYNNTFGLILGPLVDTVLKCDGFPYLGCIVGFVVDVFDTIFGFVFDLVTGAVKFLIEGLFGLDIDAAIAKVVSQIMEYLGGAPVCTGNESGGRLFNCVYGGAVVIEQAFLQTAGGVPMQAAAFRQQTGAIASSREEARKFLSWQERFFSTERSDSLFAILVMKSPTSLKQMGKDLGAIVFSTPDQVVSEFFHSATRSSSDTAVAAIEENLFAVKYYGFSEADLDSEVFGDNSEEECQTEMAEFKDAVENGGDENQPTEPSICTLDTIVANTMLCNFTDEDDCGIEQASTTAPPTDSGECAAGSRDLGEHEAYENGTAISVTLCAVTGFKSTSSESVPGNAYYVEGADGDAIVSADASEAFVGLFLKAKGEGVTLDSGSSFRTMEHQQALCAANPSCATGDYTYVAQPGYSNHQRGHAIDFTDPPGDFLDGPSDSDFNWLSANANSFGIFNYPVEPWHWSLTGG